MAAALACKIYILFVKGIFPRESLTNFLALNKNPESEPFS
jgi:hypothetical protein